MERTAEELIAHIAARVARGKPVTLSVHSGRTVMNALMAQAGSRVRTWEEDLHFELGIWDERGRLVEVIARIGNLIVARAAFRAAVIARPDEHCQRARNAFQPRVFSIAEHPVSGANWTAGPGTRVPSIKGFGVAWTDAKLFLQQTYRLRT